MDFLETGWFCLLCGQFNKEGIYNENEWCDHVEYSPRITTFSLPDQYDGTLYWHETDIFDFFNLEVQGLTNWIAF